MSYLVDSTQAFRNEIIEGVQPFLTPDSLNWVRRFFAKLYKSMLVEGDESVGIHAYPMLENIVRFINDFMDEITPTNILCSFYICGIQLGVLELGDDIEKLPEFMAGVDMEDWSLCSEEDLLAMDLRTMMGIMNRAFANNDENDITVAGLNTLQFLYHVKGVEKQCQA